MSTNNNVTIKVVRKRPSFLSKIVLWVRYYGYYYLKSYIADYLTVVSMAITREKRLYYLYPTGELVIITAYNYLQRVSIDQKEWAIIKSTTPTGYSYTKAERF